MIQEADVLQVRTLLKDVDDLGTPLVLEDFEPRIATCMISTVWPMVVVEIEVEMHGVQKLERGQQAGDVFLTEVDVVEGEHQHLGQLHVRQMRTYMVNHLLYSVPVELEMG